MVAGACRSKARGTATQLHVISAEFQNCVAGLGAPPGQQKFFEFDGFHMAEFAADVEALREQLRLFQRQLREADRQLKQFAETAPLPEQEARALLDTIPQVGPLTIDVVLSELGDWRRFRSQRAVAAFAGLNPGFRASANKCLELHITKEGSRLLRWAMIQAAWRLVGNSPKWAALFARLMHRSGKKRAIVAVARKLLCVLYAMLKTSTPYRIVSTETEAPVTKTTKRRLVRKASPEQAVAV